LEPTGGVFDVGGLFDDDGGAADFSCARDDKRTVRYFWDDSPMASMAESTASPS
jgi:hypothetical protein